MAYAINHKIGFKINKYKKDMVSPIDNMSLRPTYWENLFENLISFTEDLNNKNYPAYIEKTAYKYDIIPRIEINFKLIGYYQSYKYFEDEFERINKLIKINEKKEKIMEEYINYFADNNKKPISLHFRIGDFKKNPRMDIVLDINYYLNAIKFLKNKFPNLENTHYIFCFGEKVDNETIEMNINILKNEYKNLDFIICDYNIPDWKQLLLMSLCQYNIIANSTFSWWGAYYNNSINREICYPFIWNKLYLHMDDLFPHTWNKIVF